MRIKKTIKRDYDDDGLLPLVNIIFLLLIFFMIVGVIEKSILKDNLDLPSVELDRFQNKEVIKIYYDKDKELFIDDKKINLNDISSLLKTSDATNIVLIADKSLLVSDINKVLLVLQNNKINNIRLLSSLNAN
ncbi:MAG: biopolymer transporter ExbD [Gammaproteobacteria bacterium]